MSESVSQSDSQSVTQSVSWSVGQLVRQSVSQSASQSVNQSISQSVNQSDSRSVGRSVSQPVSQSPECLMTFTRRSLYLNYCIYATKYSLHHLQLHKLPYPSNLSQHSLLLLVVSLSSHEQDAVSLDCNVTKAWIVRGSAHESKLGAFLCPSALTAPRFCTTKAHVSLKFRFLKFSLPSVLIRLRAVVFS